MKKFILYTISSFFISMNLYAQWFPQNSTVNVNLYGVSFVDQNNGWVVGDSGAILFTSDGGTKWEKQTTNYTSALLDVSFCDNLNGFVVGDSGIILKTTNKGLEWTPIHKDTSQFIRNIKVQCMSPRTAIIFNDKFVEDYFCCTKIWKTTDGGNFWIDITPYNNDINSIKDFDFYSPKTGMVCGVGGTPNDYQIHKTIDGGLNWETKYFSSSHLWAMQNILYEDSLKWWATDWDTLYRTTNSGETWVAFSAPSFGELTNIEMFGNIGYAGRFFGKVMKTTDSGATWSEQPTSPNIFTTKIDFLNENIGWIVGWNGMIYKTINGGVTSVPSEDQILHTFSLKQNYPNPFNPSTKIKFVIPQSSFVNLKVYDVLGREVATIVNEEKQAGEYEVEFNPASGILNLASGIYFYKLQAGNYSSTKKMIYLK